MAIGPGGVAAIEGAMNLVNNAVNFGGSLLSAKLQNKWALDAWYKQQEFNSPLNQRLRLEQAGLNPALMYQGSVSNTASSAPDVTGPSFKDFTGIGNALSLYLQTKQLENQTKVADAEASLKEAQALTETDKQEYYRSIRDKNDWYRTEYGPSLIDYTNERTTYTELQIRYLPMLSVAKIDYLTASSDQKYALIDRYTELNGLTRSQNAYCLAQLSIAKQYLITATAEAQYAFAHNYLRMHNEAQDYNLKTIRIVIDRLQSILLQKDISWYEVQKIVQDLNSLTQSASNISSIVYGKGSPKYRGPWRTDTEYYGSEGEFKGFTRSTRAPLQGVLE